MAYLGSFNKISTVGSQSITIPYTPFTPSVIIFWSVGASSSGVWGASYQSLYGFYSGAGDYSVAAASLNAAATSSTARRFTNVALNFITPSNSLESEGSISSVSHTGFTINWTTNTASTGHLIHFLVLCSDVVTNAIGLAWTMPTVNNTIQAVTGAGFKPNMCLHLHAGGITSSLPASSVNAIWGFGWTGPGCTDDSTANQSNQFACFYSEGNGLTASKGAFGAMFSVAPPGDTTDTERACIWSAASSLGTVTAQGYFSSYDSDGFSVKFPVAPSGAWQAATLVMNVAFGKVYRANEPVSPSIQSFPVNGFTPSAILFGSGQKIDGNDLGLRMGFGGSDGTNSAYSITQSQYIGSGGGNSVVSNYDGADAILEANNDTQTITASASIISPSAGDAAISWTTTSGNAMFFGYVIFGPPPPFPGAWLVINEPYVGSPAVGGLTDRTNYLCNSDADRQRFTMQLRQRGTATIPMIVSASDSYAPTMGTQLWLYDQFATGFTCVFAGTIDDIELTYDGTSGQRLYTVTAVSYEQAFDTLRISPPRNYQNQTCEYIINDLLGNVCEGVPINLGATSPGLTLAFKRFDGETVAAAFDDLASECEFIWGVNPANQTLYFCPPTTVPAPTSLVNALMLWESTNWKQLRHDYRNRQIVRVPASVMPQSSELFAGTGSQFGFNLLRNPKEISFAWLTQGTQNSATGSMSGVPSPGDTVTISYPVNSSGYTWHNNTVYSVLGVAIIDPNGNVQVLTSSTTPFKSSLSGTTPPGGWGTVPGQVTADNNLNWTCQGALNTGVIGNSVYTFVPTIDNTQFGQVLIGASATACLINLVAAINQTQTPSTSSPTGFSDWGITYSLPTWENPLVNAYRSSTTVTVKNKAAGAGYTAGLAASSSAFSWGAQNTSGGSTGTTVILSVAQSGTSATANLYWQPGSTRVNCVSSATVSSGPPPSGWNLQVQYFRDGGDCIVCEDTADVVARAAIENGTGKYQQLQDEGDQNNPYIALNDAQQSIANFGPQSGASAFPVEFTFDTFEPGFLPGQQLTVSISLPTGFGTLVNGNWFIEEIQAEQLPVSSSGMTPYLPGFGHYKYTIKVVNVAQIGSYMDFWKQLAGGV